MYVVRANQRNGKQPFQVECMALISTVCAYSCPSTTCEPTTYLLDWVACIRSTVCAVIFMHTCTLCLQVYEKLIEKLWHRDCYKDALSVATTLQSQLALTFASETMLNKVEEHIKKYGITCTCIHVQML